jgi:hypothetical protein
VGSVLVVMTAPVQPDPLKKVKVADIAGEADTRRAVAMKMTLNCIMIGGGARIVQLLKEEKKWSELNLYDRRMKSRLGKKGPDANLIEIRKRSWVKT